MITLLVIESVSPFALIGYISLFILASFIFASLNDHSKVKKS